MYQIKQRHLQREGEDRASWPYIHIEGLRFLRRRAGRRDRVGTHRLQPTRRRHKAATALAFSSLPRAKSTFNRKYKISKISYIRIHIYTHTNIYRIPTTTQSQKAQTSAPPTRSGIAHPRRAAPSPSPERFGGPPPLRGGTERTLRPWPRPATAPAPPLPRHLPPDSSATGDRPVPSRQGRARGSRGDARRSRSGAAPSQHIPEAAESGRVCWHHSRRQPCRRRVWRRGEDDGWKEDAPREEGREERREAGRVPPRSPAFSQPTLYWGLRGGAAAPPGFQRPPPCVPRGSKMGGVINWEVLLHRRRSREPQSTRVDQATCFALWLRTLATCSKGWSTTYLKCKEGADGDCSTPVFYFTKALENLPKYLIAFFYFQIFAPKWMDFSVAVLTRSWSQLIFKYGRWCSCSCNLRLNPITHIKKKLIPNGERYRKPHLTLATFAWPLRLY